MESAKGTLVDAITEADLAKMAGEVRVKLTAKFGRERIANAIRDQEFFNAFAYETFLTLRIYLHRKSRQ